MRDLSDALLFSVYFPNFLSTLLVIVAFIDYLKYRGTQKKIISSRWIWKSEIICHEQGKLSSLRNLARFVNC